MTAVKTAVSRRGQCHGGLRHVIKSEDISESSRLKKLID